MAKQNGKAATVERPAGAGRSRGDLEEQLSESGGLSIGEHRGRWRGHVVQIRQADDSVTKLMTKSSAGQEWRPCLVTVLEHGAGVLVKTTKPARKVTPKKPVAKRKVAAPLNGVQRETVAKASGRPVDAREATAPVNTGGSGPFQASTASPMETALHALSLVTMMHFATVNDYSLFVREMSIRGRAGDRDGVDSMARSVAGIAKIVLGG